MILQGEVVCCEASLLSWSAGFVVHISRQIYGVHEAVKIPLTERHGSE